MLTIAELNSIAQARINDARALLSTGRYDGATYLCGYAVETALKFRIVKTHKWTGFPSENKEFAGLQSFKTHDLNLLLYLCGWATKIRNKVPTEWSNVSKWKPEARYLPPGGVTKLEAEEMVAGATRVMKALL